MKSVGKILSACAIILTVVGCHGAEEHQDIYILNKSQSTIRGGVYPTTIGGKVTNARSNKVQSMSQAMGKGGCRIINITKPANLKATQYHRLIFAKDVLGTDGEVITGAEDVIRAKVNQDQDKGVYSKVIKQFTSDKPLYYEIHDDTTTFTRKPSLKFKRVSNINCGAFRETVGNISGRAQELFGSAKRALSQASESLAKARNEGTGAPTPLPKTKEKNPKVEEIRARNAARQ